MIASSLQSGEEAFGVAMVGLKISGDLFGGQFGERFVLEIFAEMIAGGGFAGLGVSAGVDEAGQGRGSRFRLREVRVGLRRSRGAIYENKKRDRQHQKRRERQSELHIDY